MKLILAKYHKYIFPIGWLIAFVIGFGFMTLPHLYNQYVEPQMFGASLVQIRDKANAKLAEMWPVLVQKQNAYYAKHGKYFQLLITPETIVPNGADSDFSVRTPSDEKFVRDVDFTWSQKIPFQIEVREWQSETWGDGWEATVWVSVNDTIYTRTRDYQNNDTGWRDNTETLPI